MTDERRPPEDPTDHINEDSAVQFVLRINKGRNRFTTMDYYESSTYELDGAQMRIYDAVWGEQLIDGTSSKFDELLMRLARTPLFRRTQAIEQLTLGEDFATMPNSMYFSRWSHIWGSLVFIRKMNEGRDIDPREDEVMQLRTLLSDVGHTAFSHLGDWMFQTDGSNEDLHDKELKDILDVSGVAELLNEYGYTVDETVFPDIEDWVECPSPDLNVDRVDYGLREMMRWQTSFTGLNYFKAKLTDPQQLFEIVDNKLTVKDPDFATRFAIGYSLLPTEHWSQPIHRLQLQLFQVTMRRILAESLYDKGHPREAMYDVDDGFASEFMTWDAMNIVDVMKGIAVSQRRIFAQGRVNDLNSIFRLASEQPFTQPIDSSYPFPDFPDPLQIVSWQAEQFAVPHAPNLIVESPEDITVDPLTVTAQGLRFALPALKARSVDPQLVAPDGSLQRLSDYNPSYGPYLEGQRREMKKNYLVTILMHPDFAQAILKKDTEAIEAWKELLKRPRSKERLGEKIQDAGNWGAAHHFDHISDW